MASKKPSFSFKGWSLKEYTKGRKRLLVTIIGAIATFITTNDPQLTLIVGSCSELLFGLIEYFVKEK
jgi:hypothetical protein